MLKMKIIRPKICGTNRNSSMPFKFKIIWGIIPKFDKTNVALIWRIKIGYFMILPWVGVNLTTWCTTEWEERDVIMCVDITGRKEGMTSSLNPFTIAWTLRADVGGLRRNTKSGKIHIFQRQTLHSKIQSNNMKNGKKKKILILFHMDWRIDVTKYTIASMTQSTPTIDRDNITKLTNLEYTKNRSPETSAPGRIRMCNSI
jgi:hypothetical protein